MSADNCVAILHTKDRFKEVRYINAFGDVVVSEHNLFGETIGAFRIAHAQGIDSFDYLEKNQLYMLGKYMHDVWGGGQTPAVFYDETEALAAASALHDRIKWTEYGIVTVDATKYSFN